ncbi:helix-turn-helix domain-containing protein [Candidatus Sumerlaeota bacterium]|nr:helix-turn-helix domain-containing protein [Candidatus Sumerlaeota bacterium]
MLLADLGRRIRESREKRGLKQNDIAHALQISPQAVSKWERGENGPDITLLPTLSKLLGVSLDWLLGAYDQDLDVFEATVFVSSLHGAYGKSVGMPPRDYAAWANGILYQVSEAALRHDGVPIKYMGDEFLCFFSGLHHALRALEAARLARELISEPKMLKIGLSSGEIYLGKIGHPDYARPDIMGETVNLGFLTMNWADEQAKSGAAATAATAEQYAQEFVRGKIKSVTFKNFSRPVRIQELAI